MALTEQHRNAKSEISRKHGDTLIGTLRKTYGKSFAKGRGDDERLLDVLSDLDDGSLSRLIYDHDNGRLGQLCQER
jgi:hypothetical protein